MVYDHAAFFHAPVFFSDWQQNGLAQVTRELYRHDSHACRNCGRNSS